MTRNHFTNNFRPDLSVDLNNLALDPVEKAKDAIRSEQIRLLEDTFVSGIMREIEKKIKTDYWVQLES